MIPNRPYPSLLPVQQKKPLCVIPFPTNSKKHVDTFNPREYWSWGAKIEGNNCCAFQTLFKSSITQQ